MVGTPGVKPTMIGPYRLEREIARGGMGIVYLAHDTRLARTVALKSLPAEVSSEPARLERFEREAKLLASLNHPNIGAIYDIAESGGRRYLALEHIEGETLARRFSCCGALPVGEAIDVCLQIASGMETAHERGVIHRDLKPGNVMITPEGQVKIVDFGLAKGSIAPDSEITDSPVVPASSPTITSPAIPSPGTVTGVILGTAPYLSPEQARGKPVDRRTDIWSWGCILYECLTGRMAFREDTVPDTIASILKQDPDWSRLPRETPARLRELLARCLQKDPRHRLRDMGDARILLEELKSGRIDPEDAYQQPPRARSPLARFSSHAFIAVAAALLGAALWNMVGPGSRASSVQSARFTISPPESTALAGSIALSPDGNQLAFVTTDAKGSTWLWVRPIDSLRGRMLPGTQGAAHPFWSPDSRFIGFFAEGKLKKTRVDEGPPQALCNVFDARGGTWNRAGTIVFSANVGDRLYRIPETGGKPQPVTALDGSRQESSHQWPLFLPDGRRFLYLVWSELPESRGVYVGALDSNEKLRVLEADWLVAFAPVSGQSGNLVFLRGRTLMAQAFDAKSLRTTGEPVSIDDNVWYDGTTPGLAAISASENGVLAYRSGGARTTQLVWVDRAGRPLGIAAPPGAYGDPWLSPDERLIAVTRMDPQTGTRDLWRLEPARSVSSRLTFHPSDDNFPVWSPDGTHIVFASQREGTPDLYRKSASGAGADELLLHSGASKYPTDWSDDGRFIVFASWDPKTQWDLWILPMFGDRKPLRYLQNEFDSFQAVFAPGAGRIAYASNESGVYEVYVQPFPMAEGKWQVSTHGGSQPRWRSDGRELFYLAPDRKLMSVEMKPGPGFEPGPPRELFPMQVTGVVDARNHYVVSRDGQRFLVNMVVQEPSSSQITVALNWVAGLNR